MNDYELLQNFLISNRVEFALDLFNKYHKLIYRFFLNNFKGRSGMYDFEDFKQDSYFVLLDTLNHVKVDRIYAPDTWSLFPMFSWFLSAFRTKKLLSFRVDKLLLPCDISELSESDALGAEDTAYNVIIEEFDEIITTFFKKLPTHLKKTFYYKYMCDTRYTMEKIGSFQNISKQAVNLHLISLASLWEKFQKKADQGGVGQP